MQEIIIEKPYQFVPPHRGNLIPFLLQRFRIVDFYLQRYEGICSYEVRGIDHLKESLRQQSGILLTPNHCRYADPLAMAWVLRPLGVYPFAMASWHLFNQKWWQSLAIRLCGGFSVNREGIDRQALDMAINTIVDGQRPLVLFPEGTVFRSNDRLQPLLDGVTFIARTAAKRRAKLSKPPTLIHPIAIKYLFRGDVIESITPVVEEIESRFGWYLPGCRQSSMVQRVRKLSDAFLATKELEHLGQVYPGDVAQRRQHLIEHLLGSVERRWLRREVLEQEIIPRIKTLRLIMVPELLEARSDLRKQTIRDDLNRIYVAQQIASYPADYLDAPVTNTRLLETVEQLEEDLWDKARIHRPLHAILQIGQAIEVPPSREPKEAGDPLLQQLDLQLRSLLGQLADESQTLDTGI
ncbi:MAG: 1-acyl-sn-glycerol-3-phosphate acyltransferase [Pirellulaceae bacterium]|nr:1-acyl-sn-glycerol-3-phosphate acyltransferase [Pirellulaceae bacterium]